MKKILSLILLFFLTLPAFSNVSIYSTENKKFGLKDDKGNIILEEKYKKLIPLGENSYIALKGSKFLNIPTLQEFWANLQSLKIIKVSIFLTNTETTF